jgi:hypothetical protein
MLSGGHPEPRHLAREPVQAAHVLRALERVKARLLEEQRFEEAARLGEKQRQVAAVLTEIQADLRELDPPGPSAGHTETAGWEYDMRALELPAETWAEQLAHWRRTGWELLTIAEVSGAHYALLERRITLFEGHG